MYTHIQGASYVFLRFFLIFSLFCFVSFILSSLKVFEQLRRDRPEVMAKLIPVAGDVTMPGLGLSPSDLELLIDNVSLVFNSAATVRFDEDLRTAVELNVKGPQRLMQVCHQMKRLDVR